MSYGGGGPSKHVCSASSRLLSSCEGQLGILHEAWKGPFPVVTGILGYLSLFKRSQASSPFESLNRMPLELPKGCEDSCQDEGGYRSFSRVSRGDLDILSSCEMKDKPAFKSLQGNQALFRVRASPCPFHLRQQTQGPSHIPIAERSLLLRCLWKVGIPLE